MVNANKIIYQFFDTYNFLRKKIRAVPLVFPFLAAALTASCDVDAGGFFASKDLDTRLKYADSFKFVKERTITTGDDYTFLVLTDTHIKNKNARGLERLEQKFLPSDKFVVVLGDITQYGNREDVERFVEIAEGWQRAGVAVLPVIGNHDVYFGNYENYRSLIGSTRYRVDSENTALLVLDNANGFWGDAQLSWLEDELENAKPYTFIFMHVNPFASSSLIDLQSVSDVRERARFARAVKGRARYIFSGHIHMRLITELKGSVYITIEDFIRYKRFVRVHAAAGGLTWTFETL